MSYNILKGEQLGLGYLPKIMELDKEVYSDLGMEGCLEQMEKRYIANKETFVVIESEDDGEFVGYINFFPVIEKTFKEIIYDSDVIRDDDIEDSETTGYGRGCHIFIISIAIREKYRGKEAIIALSNAWIEYLNELADKYKLVKRDGTGCVSEVYFDISAVTVSGGGERFSTRCGFEVQRVIENDEKVCICENDNLVKLLNRN